MLLQQPEYLRHYKHSWHLMDNSMYELKEPLELPQLFDAAKKSKPVAVIAPDWSGDAQQTSENAVLMKQHMAVYSWGDTDKPPTTGIVVQGKDLLQRRDFFYWAQEKGFEPICFPFRLRKERSPLLAAIGNGFKADGWYHLLGLNDPVDLLVAKSFPGKWSVDTAKPCKPGLFMDPAFSNTDRKTTSWSGYGKLDFHRKYSRDELKHVLDNIAYLKTLL
jgi:hypothetical protein